MRAKCWDGGVGPTYLTDSAEENLSLGRWSPLRLKIKREFLNVTRRGGTSVRPNSQKAEALQESVGTFVVLPYSLDVKSAR